MSNFWGSVTSAFHQTNRDVAHVVSAAGSAGWQAIKTTTKVSKSTDVLEAAAIDGGRKAVTRVAAGAVIEAAPEIAVAGVIGGAIGYGVDFAHHLGKNMGWWG